MPLSLRQTSSSSCGPELRRFEEIRERRLRDAVRLPQEARVLVTGGTGCVGTALLELLAAQGISSLVSVARRPLPRRARVPGVAYERVDVRDREALEDVFAKWRPTVAFHLAAQRDPGLAEQLVKETISTNVLGTANVLAAATRSGTAALAVASTGKALRYYAREVYAASKIVGEYLVGSSAAGALTRLASVRFTHVVDNSIIGARLDRWAASGEPVLLHGPDIHFYGQSARECAELLIYAALHAEPGRARISALRNLGWPPISLRALALDVLARHGRPASQIEVTGYAPGYEPAHHPCTYDPLTAGEVSPLINALEAEEVLRAFRHDEIDTCTAPVWGPTAAEAVGALLTAIGAEANAEALQRRLAAASAVLMRHRFAQFPEASLQRLVTRAERDATGHRDQHVLLGGLGDALRAPATPNRTRVGAPA